MLVDVVVVVVGGDALFTTFFEGLKIAKGWTVEEIFAKRAVWVVFAVVRWVGGRITLSPSVPFWVRAAKT